MNRIEQKKEVAPNIDKYKCSVCGWVYDPVLEDLKGLKFQSKIGAAFGSYGWSGESVKIIEEHLD